MSSFANNTKDASKEKEKSQIEITNKEKEQLLIRLRLRTGFVRLEIPSRFGNSGDGEFPLLGCQLIQAILKAQAEQKTQFPEAKTGKPLEIAHFTHHGKDGEKATLKLLNSVGRRYLTPNGEENKNDSSHISKHEGKSPQSETIVTLATRLSSLNIEKGSLFEVLLNKVEEEKEQEQDDNDEIGQEQEEENARKVVDLGETTNNKNVLSHTKIGDFSNHNILDSNMLPSQDNNESDDTVPDFSGNLERATSSGRYIRAPDEQITTKLVGGNSFNNFQPYMEPLRVFDVNLDDESQFNAQTNINSLERSYSSEQYWNEFEQNLSEISLNQGEKEVLRRNEQIVRQNRKILSSLETEEVSHILTKEVSEETKEFIRETKQNLDEMKNVLEGLTPEVRQMFLEEALEERRKDKKRKKGLIKDPLNGESPDDTFRRIRTAEYEALDMLSPEDIAKMVEVDLEMKKKSEL